MSPQQRRAELFRVVGETLGIKRQFLSKCPAATATILTVNRTKALVQFADAPMHEVATGTLGLTKKLAPETWDIPLDWFLLPGCIEADPRQIPLFTEGE